MTFDPTRPASRFARLALFTLLAGVVNISASAKTASAFDAPTIEKNLDLPVPASPRISADGRNVLYLQSRTNRIADAFEQDAWVASTSGRKPPRKLNLGHATVAAAEWSPDGRWIAVLAATPTAPAQLMLLPSAGGVPVTLTASGQGITAFQWAPDGAHIALIAASDAPRPERMTVVGGERSSTSLWTLAVPNDMHRGMSLPALARLTTDPFTVTDLAFSPDGKAIAFSAQNGAGQQNLASSTIYSVALTSAHVTKLVSTPGPHYAPLWSPDGSSIAYVTPADFSHHVFSHARIAVVPANGGASRILDASFDEDASPTAWRNEGIYFNARDQADSGLFLLNPVTSQVRQLSLPHMMIADASISPNGSFAASLCTQPDHAVEVCAHRLTSETVTPVTLFDVPYRK